MHKAEVQRGFWRWRSAIAFGYEDVAFGSMRANEQAKVLIHALSVSDFAQWGPRGVDSR